MIIKYKEPSIKDWNRFVKEGLVIGEKSNTKFDFQKMSKMFGLSYIYYLNIAFLAKEDLSTEEFCLINGEVPVEFINKFTI